MKKILRIEKGAKVRGGERERDLWTFFERDGCGCEGGVDPSLDSNWVVAREGGVGGRGQAISWATI
jgi:hypothetical protein